MRSILSSAALLIGLAASLPFPASAKPRADLPAGSVILERVLNAEERVYYSGEQVFSVSSNKGASETIAKEIHFSPGRSRIEYLNPPEIRGRLVVNDGRWRWEYDPAEKVVIRSSILRRPVGKPAVKLTLSRVTRSYNIQVSRPKALIAGRPVFKLEFRPKTRDRESKVWWVDAAKSIVLRRDVLDTSGKLRQSSRYRVVDFASRPSASLASFVIPPNVKVVNRTEQRVSSSLADARKHLPSWAKIPDSIGAGFWFDNARVIRTSGVQTVQVQYSDGLVALSLFLSPGDRKPESNAGAVQTVDLGNLRASLIQPFPPYRVLYWYFDGKTYSLVADVSVQTLVAIARQLL